jgi:hypothetical protein
MDLQSRLKAQGSRLKAQGSKKLIRAKFKVKLKAES